MTHKHALALINARYRRGDRDICVRGDVYRAYVSGLVCLTRLSPVDYAAPKHPFLVFKLARIRRARMRV